MGEGGIGLEGGAADDVQAELLEVVAGVAGAFEVARGDDEGQVGEGWLEGFEAFAEDFFFTGVGASSEEDEVVLGVDAGLEQELGGGGVGFG
ncbi:MAG: hypothetical protein RI897_4115 [Verrucomicrobiota bacterium]